MASKTTFPAKVLLLLCIFYLVSFAVARRCKYNELDVCKDVNVASTCRCAPCPTCQLGEGLYPKCGEGIRIHSIKEAKCIPCINGSTYSEYIGIASCTTCNSCGNKIVLQPCTTKHRANCSTACKPGYVLNDFLNQCQLIPQTTATPSLTTDSPLTTEYGPSIPTTLPSTVAEDVVSTKQQIDLMTVKENLNKEKRLETEKPQKDDHGHLTTLMWVIITLVVFVVLLVILIALLKYFQLACFKKIPTQDQAKDPSHSTLLNDVDSSANSSTSNSVIEMMLLIKDLKLNAVPPEILDVIATKVSEDKSGVNNWKKIAEKAEVGKGTIDTIGIHMPGDKLPGQKLFDVLFAEKPNLTLQGFVDILKAIKRNDIVEKLREFYTIP